MPDISLKAIILVLCGVAGLWVLTPTVMYFLFDSMDKRGQAGDLFGAINALFSGLAFCGVVFAILLQRQELALQRQELKETRLEMKRTADAQEAAQQALNKTIWAQSFKVALDTVEVPDLVHKREYIVRYRDLFQNIRSEWTDNQHIASDEIIRSFETVGTMIRRGLLPLDYFDGWCIAITRSWEILERGIRELRGKRDDYFIARDFEWLAGQMQQFLPGKADTELR